MRELTIQDCEVVSGGFGPVGAGIDAVTGATTYIGATIGSGTGLLGGLLNSTVKSEYLLASQSQRHSSLRINRHTALVQSTTPQFLHEISDFSLSMLN